MTARPLDTATLDAAAAYYASHMLRPDRPHRSVKGRFIGGPSFVAQEFFNFTFKDEFDDMQQRVREHMGARAKAAFDDLAKKTFTPREDKVFEALLEEKLAVRPSGEHIEGKIGATVLHGMRPTIQVPILVETPDSIRRRKRLKLMGRDPGPRETMTKLVTEYWPIYAGEPQERTRPGGGAADPLPEGTPGLPVGAFATRISNVAALAANDAMVDLLDEGTGAALLRPYTTPRPANVDDAATGTLLGTLVCSDPAFGASADDNPGAVATAGFVTDDVSADATGTMAYCRASSSNDGATPLDDHIEGEAGTAGADFIWNTLAVVAGGNLGLTSWVYRMAES